MHDNCVYTAAWTRMCVAVVVLRIPSPVGSSILNGTVAIEGRNTWTMLACMRLETIGQRQPDIVPLFDCCGTLQRQQFVSSVQKVERSHTIKPI